MTRAIALLAIVLVPATVLAQVARADFARGIEIETDGGGSIFRVVLPEDVYRTVTRDDLADVRVLNAAGNAVPHTLRRAELPTAIATPVAVPSFPLYRKGDAASALTQVRIDELGAVLEVRRGSGESQTVSAYLLDASTIKTPVDRISLDLESSDNASFLARVEVQGSDDLNRWTTAVASAAVARMRHGDYVLTQSDIELSPVRYRYLRILWPKELGAVTLKSARLRPRVASRSAETRWTTLSARQLSVAGAAEYDAQAKLPVERVDLEFADPTDAAFVTIRTRFDPSSEWQTRYSGLFYTLNASGERITNSAVQLGQTVDRYWIVETSREGGWQKDRLPRLKLGWHPHELLFLAQGSAPFTLVYGSARVGPADAPVDAVLASLAVTDARDRTRVATLGSPRDLGGAAVLRPAPPWRQIALWAVLIGAVLVLGGFAWRLARSA